MSYKTFSYETSTIVKTSSKLGDRLHCTVGKIGPHSVCACALEITWWSMEPTLDVAGDSFAECEDEVDFVPSPWGWLFPQRCDYVAQSKAFG